MPCYNGGNHSEDYVRQAEERLSERNNMPCSDGGYGRDYENNRLRDLLFSSLLTKPMNFAKNRKAKKRL
jgi:hypothetical protein